MHSNDCQILPQETAEKNPQQPGVMHEILRQKSHTKFPKKFTRKEMFKDWGKQAFCTFFPKEGFQSLCQVETF